MRRLLLLLWTLSSLAQAEEGMWTYDNFPAEAVAKQYGFKPDQAWLDKVRLSSARLAQGCSGSFVSSQGLVMTNHHCAHSCIQQLSTKTKDLSQDGFYAADAGKELRCPNTEINQLEKISDVTARVEEATKGKEGKSFATAQKAAFSKIESECATSDKVRCDVVTLYAGGRYALYQYRRFQDVRLVFAPEFSIAFFGGDPSNFTFPRYDYDVSFMRIYEDGKPAATTHYFPFSKKGAEADELVFVSGHPGHTNREDTIAELTYERDILLPRSLAMMSEARGLVSEFGQRGAEQKRISTGLLFGIENGLKASKGRREALVEPSFFAAKVAAEQKFQAEIAAKPELKEKYGEAWNIIGRAVDRMRPLQQSYQMIEGGRGFDSDIFRIARTLVRHAAESSKPNEERLREFSESSLPQLKQRVFSEAPIYSELEELRLRFGLEKLREILGPSHPVVMKALGKQSPAKLAASLVKGSKLRDLAERKRLFEGGAAAIAASQDPMIKLAVLVDPEARALRKTVDEEINSEINRGHELIARAKFALHGTSVYPDATFTLRLNYGKVQGLTDAGVEVPALTRMGDLFSLHTGEEPFALPGTWLKSKAKINPATPMNFASSNDIIGGNSGSPVINKDAEIVGLIFDGNIWSLGGSYGFDPQLNRAVSVHSAGILEGLEKVYKADALVRELRGDKVGHH